MATVILSAAGAAVGGAVGGQALGLSAAVWGRFAGAAVGRVLDQRLLGQGSGVVEQGRVDRLRLTGAGEGAPVPHVFGRVRIGGQVIWASAFAEHVSVTQGSRGGKGTPQPATPTTVRYSYSVSLAVALCAGPIAGVQRVWADGAELAVEDVVMRVYTGSDTQLPDPKIEAIEGAGSVPAYRGTAYVVFEDLPLEAFGNRVPQFSFEVLCPEENGGPDGDPAQNVQAVALMPGTGEYALASQPVSVQFGPGAMGSRNVNTPSGQPDLVTALDALALEAPACQAVSLVVSWFGDDLRAGQCQLRPLVEQRNHDGREMPWQVSGLGRAQAGAVPHENGRAVYGGTPADASVVQAIRLLRGRGQAVMFYPFILMQQLSGNGRPDPWGQAAEQPRLPWRGRITGAFAPGQPGSPDGTDAADAEVASFMGQARAHHFQITGGQVFYSGPEDWGYARFILHYAALCAAAGGVDSFCIGSEMRGLSTLRGRQGFPFVQALRGLAGEVRSLLGADVKLGYAADWSEYFGYHPQDGSNDLFFHLDPLWADPEIDFIGIDNYMPLSDWRDGEAHLDAHWGDGRALGYLQAGIEGGEGYDWYYPSPEARAAQQRQPITDGAYGEPWVWRYKDMRNWWANPHHERIAGLRQEQPTPWVPMSKPIWFTEFGCPAVDKGANQPNKFLDPKSSESGLPFFSNGQRDDAMQMAYLRAMLGYWARPEVNPISPVYGGAMIDMTRAFVWAWDARPYPAFPGRQELWDDGQNHARGHWVTGRLGTRSVGSVIKALCGLAGLARVDTSALPAVLSGYVLDDISDIRRALQPLMLAYGVDVADREGVLTFLPRTGRLATSLESADLVQTQQLDAVVQITRAAEAEMQGRVRLKFFESGGNYDVIAEETVLPDDQSHMVSTTEIPLVMTRAQGRQLLERWLAEARVARDVARFALPPSRVDLGVGDLVRLPGVAGQFRIDRIEEQGLRLCEATRAAPMLYQSAAFEDTVPRQTPFLAALPVDAVFLDLPLMRGQEQPHAPHVAISAEPWQGAVAVYGGSGAQDFSLDLVVGARATMGALSAPLDAHPPGRFDWGGQLEVQLISGHLTSVTPEALLSGANLAAIGDGSPEGWELVQFGQAQLLAPGRFLLRQLLRGQLGSEAVMPAQWPVGSRFVLLDQAVEQLPMAPSQRGIERQFRIGPARRPVTDASFTPQRHAFAGVGLRPLAPVHLRAVSDAGGLALSWVRRTRIDGDAWEGLEVPLGEESERYLLRILQAGQIRHEELLSTPHWDMPAALAATLAPGGFQAEVAQVSAVSGPGYSARLMVQMG